MTDKETEIKALTGTLYDLKEDLSKIKIGMTNSNTSYEERKKYFEEYNWIHYQIEIAEKKIEAASI